jgi:hypothetical protein
MDDLESIDWQILQLNIEIVQCKLGLLTDKELRRLEYKVLMLDELIEYEKEKRG